MLGVCIPKLVAEIAGSVLAVTVPACAVGETPNAKAATHAPPTILAHVFHVGNIATPRLGRPGMYCYRLPCALAQRSPHVFMLGQGGLPVQPYQDLLCFRCPFYLLLQVRDQAVWVCAAVVGMAVMFTATRTGPAPTVVTATAPVRALTLTIKCAASAARSKRSTITWYCACFSKSCQATVDKT